MIYIYFIDIFKCKVVYSGRLCVMIHTYVPHTFLFRMFITYVIYTIVTSIKVKSVAEKKMHLKNASTVLIAVLNLLLGMLCCFVVKRNKLKVR